MQWCVWESLPGFFYCHRRLFCFYFPFTSCRNETSLLFFLWPCLKAHRVLVPCPGIEPLPMKCSVFTVDQQGSPQLTFFYLMINGDLQNKLLGQFYPWRANQGLI